MSCAAIDRGAAEDAKAEDVLKVYQELTKVRGEIERVKGRMQYLGNLAALAIVTIELIPDILAKPVVEPGWRPLGDAQERRALAGQRGQGIG